MAYIDTVMTALVSRLGQITGITNWNMYGELDALSPDAGRLQIASVTPVAGSNFVPVTVKGLALLNGKQPNEAQSKQWQFLKLAKIFHPNAASVLACAGAVKVILSQITLSDLESFNQDGVYSTLTLTKASVYFELVLYVPVGEISV